MNNFVQFVEYNERERERVEYEMTTNRFLEGKKISTVFVFNLINLFSIKNYLFSIQVYSKITLSCKIA